MARVPVASDNFDSSIDGSWANGPGDWGTMTWQTGGYVRPTTADENAMIGRNTGTYANDQYSQIVTQVVTAGDNAVGAVVRWTGSANEACYFGQLYAESSAPKYLIVELNNSFSFTVLASAGTGAGIGAGVTAWMEAEGTALRLSTDEGSGETSRLSTTDATIASGRPGVFTFAAVTTTEAMVTSWVGGDIVTNVSVNLTGQSITSAAGSMAGSRALPVSGQSSTAQQGTLVPTFSRVLAGLAMTAAQGNVATTRAVSIVGQSSAASPGTVAAGVSVALAGQSASVALGNLITALALALTGQGVTLQQGVLSAGGNVTVALTGQALAAAQGALGHVAILGLTGAGMTATGGTLAYAAALQLVGAALASAAGIITTGNDVSVTLTGQQIAAALGTVGVQRAALLTGSAALAQQGQMIAAHVAALSGQSVTAARGTLTPVHAAALSGQSVDVAPGTVAVLRALALLGIPATLSAGTLTAQQGTNVTVSLTGLAMLAEQGLVTPEVAAALAGAAVSIAAGTMEVYAPTVPAGTPAPLLSLQGTIASRNPVAVHLAGQGALVAGPYGVKLGRFAWANDAGQVSNARMADESLGFALMQAPIYGRSYWSNGALVLRAAQALTMIKGGDVWARFDGGAEIGAQVYARRLDGQAVAGYAPHSDPTPWYVATEAAPGGLAIISTWRTPPA